MFKNLSKMLFFIMLIMSTLLIISSNSWLSIWMMLEINVISFISYILINKKSNFIESSTIYFISQSLASIIFLFSILMNMMVLYFMFNYSWMLKILLMSLLMKMGTAPLHFWLPLVMEGLNWINNYLLMTWQKLGPMILISYNMNYFIILFIVITSIIGALGGLNQSSIKKLMSFSSINHISWFLLSMMTKKLLWEIYFFFYFFMMMNVILLFNKFNLNFMNQFYLINMNKMIILFMFFAILSMGGLPPFLGFFPKMLIILSSKNFMTLTLMIFCALINLYFYLRMLYFLFLMNFKKINYKNNNKYKLNSILKLSFITNLFLLIIILF